MKRVKKERQFVSYSLTLYQVLQMITSNVSHVSPDVSLMKVIY